MIAGIVLAAGASTRLGRPKQLLDLVGKPVLRHVLDAALASPFDEVIVVLGYAAREIAQAVPPTGRVRIAFNPDFAGGQSTSLRVGLRAVNATADAAVILLGDQPGVRAQAVTRVVEEWLRERGPVVQAAYGGRPAHPTLLDRSVWPEVELATDDQGARAVIGDHPEWRRLVEVGGSPPDDIDTEDDYRRVLEAFAADRDAGATP